jgi:hypothetical protein
MQRACIQALRQYYCGRLNSIPKLFSVNSRDQLARDTITCSSVVTASTLEQTLSAAQWTGTLHADIFFKNS